MCELDDLRVRAAKAAPPGINLTRFFRWVDAETSGDGVGVATGNTTLSNYRKFLYALNVDHEPAHKGDVDLAELPCAFGNFTASRESHRNLTERGFSAAPTTGRSTG